MKSKQGYPIALLLSVTISIRAFQLLADAHHPWPAIKPVSTSFYFPDVNGAAVSLYLRDLQGRPIYWFGCHSTDFTGKPSDPFHDDEYDYYGMFDCHLHLLSDKNGHNLLSYSADHLENFSRAFMVPEDLQGRCADYPEWGRVRHIRLRGMRITLEFSEVRLGEEIKATGDQKPEGRVVSSFRFDLRIEPNKSTLSPIAEPPGFEDPLRVLPGSAKNISDDCAKVIPEHLPQ